MLENHNKNLLCMLHAYMLAYLHTYEACMQCMYMYICTHIYMHACIHACVRMYVLACAYVHACIVHIYTCACVHNIRAYVKILCTCTYIHRCICHAHTHAYKCMRCSEGLLAIYGHCTLPDDKDSLLSQSLIGDSGHVCIGACQALVPPLPSSLYR